jgi:glycosyltransferase involved in cell wall biosynthesis
MKRPLISVVTVTFNAEDYLEETLNSIHSQTFKDFEYIIVDGGSTDKTISLIESCPRVDFFLSEKDSGVYDAMNKATLMARGQWIIFINAGDTFCDSNILSNISEYLDEKFDIIYGNINYKNNLKNESFIIIPPSLDRFSELNPIPHQGAFIKKTLQETFLYDLNYKLAADYDFFYRCYMGNRKFLYINQTIANYLAGGLSESDPTLARLETLKVVLNNADNIKDSLNSSFFRGLVNTLDFIENTNLDFSKNLNIIYEQILEIKSKYKNILIYGNSLLFKLMSFILVDNVVGVLDNNKKKATLDIVDINSINYDIILILVIGREEEISNRLINEYKISSHKILFLDLKKR